MLIMLILIRVTSNTFRFSLVYNTIIIIIFKRLVATFLESPSKHAKYLAYAGESDKVSVECEDRCWVTNWQRREQGRQGPGPEDTFAKRKK